MIEREEKKERIENSTGEAQTVSHVEMLISSPCGCVNVEHARPHYKHTDDVMWCNRWWSNGSANS